MDLKEVAEAAEKRLPVVCEGAVYKEILEYTRWFDNNRNKMLSVVLLDKNGGSRVRVLASKVTLAESGSKDGKDTVE